MLPSLAGVIAVAAIVGGGLWVWKPWRSLELPQSACWSALSKDDLKPLAGPYGEMYEPAPTARIMTPTTPNEGDIRGTDCVLRWSPNGYDVLQAEVAPAWDGIDADRTQDSRGAHPVATLDFGPGAAGLATTNTSERIRLYVRCDFQLSALQTIAKPGLKAPPYIRIDVGGDSIDGASPAKARQAYADIALKIGRVAAGEYQCTNRVQLPAAAPIVPELVKEKADD
ncbi:hypothetical protein [Kitasatospora aureofaciens]|uniref:hypothetical protein n=1 Tax=Kitasatospora aureofaciens TaxID=1894 RepID=UPI0037C61444